jgi:elongation factor G
MDPELTMSECSSRFHLIEIKVEPKSKTDTEKLVSALASLVRSDPNAFCTVDAQSGEILIGGANELHLEKIVQELMSQGVAINVGAPQVAYRETISRKTTVDYTHKRLTGGTGQFARVILEIEPNQNGAGYAFECRIVDGAVPREFVPGVEMGLNSVMGSGILVGFPVVDIKIALVGGAYHEVDSSAIAFEIASRAALREGLQKAGAILLEPIMKVEVTSPEDYLGGVIGDLHWRRGQIMGTSSRGNAQIVNAMVPLANMFGYINKLRSMSQERASYTMTYSHYQAVETPGTDDFPPAIGMRA